MTLKNLIIIIAIFFFSCETKKTESHNIFVLETLKSDGYWLYSQINHCGNSVNVSKDKSRIISLVKTYTKCIFLIKSHVVSSHEGISELSTDTINDRTLKRLHYELSGISKRILLGASEKCINLQYDLEKIGEKNSMGYCVPFEVDIDYNKIVNYEGLTEEQYLTMLYKYLNAYYKSALCMVYSV